MTLELSSIERGSDYGVWRITAAAGGIVVAITMGIGRFDAHQSVGRDATLRTLRNRKPSRAWRPASSLNAMASGPKGSRNSVVASSVLPYPARTTLIIDWGLPQLLGSEADQKAVQWTVFPTNASRQSICASLSQQNC